MTEVKKNGRPPERERGPDEVRHIPLRLRHSEVQRLDVASALSEQSRSAWCHDTLVSAAEAIISDASAFDKRKAARRGVRRA